MISAADLEEVGLERGSSVRPILRVKMNVEVCHVGASMRIEMGSNIVSMKVLMRVVWKACA